MMWVVFVNGKEYWFKQPEDVKVIEILLCVNEQFYIGEKK